MNSPLQNPMLFEKESSNLYGKKVLNSIYKMCFNMVRQKLVPYNDDLCVH